MNDVIAMKLLESLTDLMNDLCDRIDRQML